jgi:hypothetical protein
MKMLHSLHSLPRFFALAFFGIVVAGCARDLERVRTDWLVSLVPAPQSCDVVPADPSYLRGPYLRSAGDFRNLEIVHLSGGEGKNALAASMRIDEGGVRIPLTGEGGTFTLTRGTAPPLTGLTPAQVLTHFGAA